jgi:hypothetical protein
MKLLSWWTALVLGAFSLASCGGLQAVVFEDPTYHEERDDRGSDSEMCRVLSGCQLPSG